MRAEEYLFEDPPRVPVGHKFRLIWAPEGRTIAIVEAKDLSAARKLAPLPYRKYLGEIRVELVEPTNNSRSRGGFV